MVVGEEQWNESYEQCSSINDSVLGADREVQRQDSIMQESKLLHVMKSRLHELPSFACQRRANKERKDKENAAQFDEHGRFREAPDALQNTMTADFQFSLWHSCEYGND